jgi:serine protease Do
MIGVNSMISRKAKDGLAITGVNFSIKSRVVLGWLDSVGFNFKYISTINSNDTRIENSQNAGVVPIPKPRKSTTKPQQKINNKKKEPKIWTKIRPYKNKDLIKQVEDEMEDMMNEMKTNSK